MKKIFSVLMALGVVLCMIVLWQGPAVAGVSIINLTPEMAGENNSDPNSPILLPETTGVLVVRVTPDTPALGSGLRRGDVIVEIDGKPITTADRLQKLVDRSGVEKVLQVKLIRNNQTLQLSIKTAQLQDTL